MTLKKSKILIISAMVLAVLLIGSTAGIVLAQTGTDGQSRLSTMMDRVAAIYKEKTGTTIDSAKLQESMTQAQQEARDKALNDQLQKMVDAGKITKEQAEQYKTWLKSRPDMSQYNQQIQDWMKNRPQLPSDMKNWQNSRPNMPAPGPFQGGFGGKRGMMSPGCLPQ